jgi:hypothetical protein
VAKDPCDRRDPAKQFDIPKSGNSMEEMAVLVEKNAEMSSKRSSSVFLIASAFDSSGIHANHQ